MLGRGSDGGSDFSFATDERTMASHLTAHKRAAPISPTLLAKMKTFVKTFYRDRAETSAMARSDEAGMAPVLKPRKGIKYRFNA